MLWLRLERTGLGVLELSSLGLVLLIFIITCEHGILESIYIVDMIFIFFNMWDGWGLGFVVIFFLGFVVFLVMVEAILEFNF